ncbi:MAG: bifunctional 4-hydroxy-3-methylbut-2-enyl diphosphate reductase/30S ribosomal protein S1 [Clostridiales bacterium]
MEIIKANTAGFCFGVNNAVNVTYKLAREGKKKIYTLGPIIHNNQVVEELNNMGVETIDDIKNIDIIKDDSIIVIRAHGVTPEVYEELKKKNIEIVDATCPYVKKIHVLVKEEYDKGNQIIIIGDKNHPEVIGIDGWANNLAFIVNSMEDIERISEINKSLAVFAQTTITFKKWNDLNKYLKEKFKYIEKFDTICSATTHRQKEAEEISKQVDFMLVIGSKNSSNTHKLFEVCKENCSNTFKIETVNEIPNLNNYNINKVGITAGASTPYRIIKEVIDKMSENIKPEGEKDFSEMIEESLKKIRSGEIVKGRIIKYNESEVFVDLGFKSDGIIPMEEFTEDPEFDKSQLDIGSEIEVYVINVNDGEGNVKLSKKRVDAKKMWEEIYNIYKEKKDIEVKIANTVNKGVIAIKKGVKIFIPASHLGNKRINDLNEFLNKVVKIRIIEFDESKKKVIGSQKIVLEEERKENEKVFWDEIEKGKIYSGKVKSLTKFGAFVDIGGVDGLVHISELSWSRIKHPSEVINVDDSVEVTILEFNKESKKVSLGYRKSKDNPWANIEEKYPIGKIIEGKVVRMVPFGVFIDLEKGVDGLVHISQISTKRLAKPDDVLEIGQIVEVKVLDVNSEKQKISLSIKEVNPIDIEEKEEVQRERNNKKSEIKKKKEEAPKEHIEEATNTIGEIFRDKLKDMKKE